jgi:hypothetical protein
MRLGRQLRADRAGRAIPLGVLLEPHHLAATQASLSDSIGGASLDTDLSGLDIAVLETLPWKVCVTHTSELDDDERRVAAQRTREGECCLAALTIVRRALRVATFVDAGSCLPFTVPPSNVMNLAVDTVSLASFSGARSPTPPSRARIVSFMRTEDDAFVRRSGGGVYADERVVVVRGVVVNSQTCIPDGVRYSRRFGALECDDLSAQGSTSAAWTA